MASKRPFATSAGDHAVLGVATERDQGRAVVLPCVFASRRTVARHAPGHRSTPGRTGRNATGRLVRIGRAHLEREADGGFAWMAGAETQGEHWQQPTDDAPAGAFAQEWDVRAT